MTIVLNGEPMSLPDSTSLSQLLEQLQLEQSGVAIALNTQIVPRSSYQSTSLAMGDRVEIIRAVGGG